MITRLGFSVNESQLKGYERGITNIKSRADEAANSFRNMFAAFVGFQGLKSLANTADEMQSIEARIGKLPQTVGTAAESFDAVANRANLAKQGIEAYAGFYIKAANATQDFISNQEDVLAIVDGVAMGLAASGASAASQSQAFFQLGQAIGSPTVQMEEMNTLIDVAPDLFRALGKAIPGANGNLKKFISTGEVTGKMLAEGLVKVMPEFEKQMRSMPMTIGTASLLINNKWATMVNKLNRESGAVTSVANFLMDGFDSIESGFKSVIDFFGGAKNTVKAFGIVLAAALAPLTANLLLGAITTLASPIGLLIGGLILVGIAIDDIMTYLRGGESITGDFIKWLKEGSLGAGLLVGALTLLTAALTAWGVTSVIAFTKAGLAALAFGANVLIGMLPVIALPALIVAGIVAVVAAIYMLWANWSDIWGWIKNIASETWKSVTDGFFSMVNKLKGYWNDFKSFFGLGASTTITAGKVAGAASSASGVAGAGTGANMNVTVNQELPAGTTKETADAAKNASMQVFTGGGNDILSRQMAAYSL